MANDLAILSRDIFLEKYDTSGLEHMKFYLQDMTKRQIATLIGKTDLSHRQMRNNLI